MNKILIKKFSFCISQCVFSIFPSIFWLIFSSIFRSIFFINFFSVFLINFFDQFLINFFLSILNLIFQIHNGKYLSCIQTAIDQLHMHFITTIHNRSFAIVMGFVEVSLRKNGKSLQENLTKKPYQELCHAIAAEYFVPTLLELCKSMWDVMKTYRAVIQWHLDLADQRNKSREDANAGMIPPWLIRLFCLAVYWYIVWLIDWLSLLIDCHRLIDWLSLIDRLTDWLSLIDRLIDWLIDWLILSLFLFLRIVIHLRRFIWPRHGRSLRAA